MRTTDERSEEAPGPGTSSVLGGGYHGREPHHEVDGAGEAPSGAGRERNIRSGDMFRLLPELVGKKM
jgi:hypothetical protein